MSASSALNLDSLRTELNALRAAILGDVVKNNETVVAAIDTMGARITVLEELMGVINNKIDGVGATKKSSAAKASASATAGTSNTPSAPGVENTSGVPGTSAAPVTGFVEPQQVAAPKKKFPLVNVWFKQQYKSDPNFRARFTTATTQAQINGDSSYVGAKTDEKKMTAAATICYSILNKATLPSPEAQLFAEYKQMHAAAKEAAAKEASTPAAALADTEARDDASVDGDD